MNKSHMIQRCLFLLVRYLHKIKFKRMKKKIIIIKRLNICDKSNILKYSIIKWSLLVI